MKSNVVKLQPNAVVRDMHELTFGAHNQAENHLYTVSRAMVAPQWQLLRDGQHVRWMGNLVAALSELERVSRVKAEDFVVTDLLL